MASANSASHYDFATYEQLTKNQHDFDGLIRAFLAGRDQLAVHRNMHRAIALAMRLMAAAKAAEHVAALHTRGVH